MKIRSGVSIPSVPCSMASADYEEEVSHSAETAADEAIPSLRSCGLGFRVSVCFDSHAAEVKPYTGREEVGHRSPRLAAP